ncbi:MAG: VOC family protein [Vicinamibacterales bacterium]
MTLTTYVNFAGRCAEAFEYYVTHLGGTIVMIARHGEVPGPRRMPDGWDQKVLHGRIVIGGLELLGADIPHAEPMRSAYLTLRVDDDATAERVYAALAEQGQVFMPIAETPFASRFGQLRDRFGINWMILHERPAPSR